MVRSLFCAAGGLCNRVATPTLPELIRLKRRDGHPRSHLRPVIGRPSKERAMYETDQDLAERELFKLVAVAWLAITGAAAVVTHVIV
jgi:hypothetical protein